MNEIEDENRFVLPSGTLPEDIVAEQQRKLRDAKRRVRRHTKEQMV